MKIRVRTAVELFALTLALDAVSACDDPDHGGGSINVGDTVRGELGGDDHGAPSMQWARPIDAGLNDDAAVDSDAAIAELDASYEGELNADTFTLDLDAGQSVQVVMCTAGDNNVLDPYLIVDFAGSRILADDDSAGDVNARVQIDALEAGRYTIFATVVTQVVAYEGNRSYVLRVAPTDTDGGSALGCE